ncbi:hypothetical protein LOTGIDRAFT_168935 [Lottia gigantea]|uniref:Uncharacterized protein n=1 Tax=Lottia gigantea TaxID=225164 RepID=V4B5V7_LOTGI|nr:hypothetical protein LOTGIDRAFT_168935 [Lottia gigantea]ESO83894.1 hypothetical protein LOTGIDRAFT_168935 [Lottia gigantea]
MYYKSVLFLFLLFSTYRFSNGQCSNKRGCFPKVKDFVADTANTAITLSATSTCSAPTRFEGLGTADGKNFTCNVNNKIDNVRDRSPFSYEVDGKTLTGYNPNLDTYWQSGLTIATEGAVATPQVLELNLGSNFTIKDIKLYFKALNSPKDVKYDSRPKAIYFEKLDKDNNNWVPWRYFAENCNDFSGVEEQKVGGPDLSATSAFCVKDGHKIGGNAGGVHNDTFFVEFNPGLEYDPEFTDNKEVADHFVTSGIRVQLHKPNSDKPLQSYYVVSDLSVHGYCYCYGHSSVCKGQNSDECECEHNTMGAHCEECMPLYNNQTWKMGKRNEANVCQKCFCNDHAESCHYDEGKGYGVCDNCLNNTKGDFCDECISGYSINSYYTRDKTNETVTPPKPTGTCQDSSGASYDCGSYCILCGCNLEGTVKTSLNNCASNGTCDCKTNVQGEKCSECKDGFWGLAESNVDGCTECEHIYYIFTYYIDNYLNDLHNNNNNNAETFNLTSENEDGCTQCDCDPGASKSNICDVTNGGQCECLNNIATRDCRTTVTGYFAPKLDYFKFEAEFQTGILEGNKVDRPGEGVSDGTVTGRGLISLPASNTIQLEFDTQLNKEFDIVLRYESSSAINGVTGDIKQLNGVPYECNGASIAADKVWAIPAAIPQAQSRGGLILARVCGRLNQKYTLTLTTTAASSLLIDSIVVLPVLETLQIYTSGDDKMKQKITSCREASFGVNMPNRQSLNCTELEYSIMTQLIGGAMPCNCNSEGSVSTAVCNQYGGQCDCKEGVTMRDCSICRVDSYGIDITNGCTLCNCNVGGSIKQSCNMTGDCSCKTNVTGKQCDQCLPDQYGLSSGNGCQDCTCNMLYSVNNTCADSGQCICKPGIGQQNCDQCLPGFYNLTNDGCTECGCHAEGSINNVCDSGTGKCTCREMTTGEKCDQCVDGYFGVGGWSDEGCIKCLCSGHSTNCSTGQGWFQAVKSSAWSIKDESAVDERWLGVDSEGNSITVDDEYVGIDIVMRITNTAKYLDASHLYFKAPAKYMGDKRSAYGQYFTMNLRLSTHDELLGNYTEGDICIRGKYTDFVLAKDIALPGTEKTTYNITMKESEWYINGTDKVRPTYTQFIQVLSGIDFIKVRGKWSNATDAETDLYDFDLYISSKTNTTGSQPINNVESCYCPPEYQGEFCERCADGFKREKANGGPFSKCIPCGCNGHSAGPCDDTTGICNCTHNTKGDKCQLCMDGYFGDATTGTANDCKPCMCPGNVVQGDVNVFATTCQLDNGNQKCINCSEGHGGNRCEICLENYYGEPENAQVKGGKCVPCVCNDRADTCNTTTGVCIDCRNNTAGKECDICTEKYFGDAMTYDCKLCSCDSVGSDGKCNAATGQCECYPNVQGFNCDQCVPNSFNLTSGTGCQMCDCHAEGAIGLSCDVITGQCTCRSNVINRQCDACQAQFYKLNTVTGCDSCGCTEEGTAEATVTGGTKGVCNLITGDCTCKQPGIIGRTCNTCSKNTKETYSGFVSVFNIGKYPNCVLCGECFDGWARKMDNIGLEFNDVEKKTNDIWANYGFKTGESVTDDLNNIKTSILNANESVSRAENITNIVNNLTQELNMVVNEVNQLSTMLMDIETRLNSSIESLASVASFNGDIEIDNITYTAESLDTKLTELTDQINAAYDKANKSFIHIQELSVLVGSADQTTQQLRTRVQTAMSTLTVAEQTFNTASTVYNDTFLPGYNENEKSLSDGNQALTSARTLLTELNSIITEMTTQFESANTTMNTVIQKTDEVKTRLETKLQESQTAYSDAKGLSTIATEAFNLVRQYKAAADKAFNDITGAFVAVLDGSKQLININNKIADIKTMVVQVNDVTIRDKSELEVITTQIRETTISDADVAQANQNAQNALETAKNVLNITEKALDDSRTALEEVKGIQENINDASNLRANATTLKTETDSFNNTIYNAIGQASSKVSEVGQLVTKTTAEVTNVQSFIAKTSQCYSDAKSRSESSRNTANVALQQAKEVEKQQGEYTATETALNTDVDSKSTNQAVSELQTTKTSLDNVIGDLSKAQQIADITNMITLYGAQKTEMNQLQTDINNLEKELDDMLQALELTSESSTCVHS